MHQLEDHVATRMPDTPTCLEVAQVVAILLETALEVGRSIPFGGPFISSFELEMELGGLAPFVGLLEFGLLEQENVCMPDLMNPQRLRSLAQSACPNFEYYKLGTAH